MLPYDRAAGQLLLLPTPVIANSSLPPSLTAISMFAIGWLGARMYQIGSGGRSPVADAGAIAKQFAANVGSCLTKPANLYSEPSRPGAVRAAQRRHHTTRACRRRCFGMSSPPTTIPTPPYPQSHPASLLIPHAGAYYSFLAVSSLGLFAWLFPTDATPLFPGGLDAVGRYLTRGTAVGMWLVGEPPAGWPRG